MSIQAALPLEYDLWGRLPVQVEAVEEHVASDAGLLSIRALDQRLGWTAGFAAQLRGSRVGGEHAKTAPKLSAWPERNVPEGLTVFDFPVAHRRKLRTHNGQERLNRELKRRTCVASIFPNEASLLRLATAVLMETDDEWETEKRYLPKTAP